jgi:hypothetical protein
MGSVHAAPPCDNLDVSGGHHKLLAQRKEVHMELSLCQA